MHRKPRRFAALTSAASKALRPLRPRPVVLAVAGFALLAVAAGTVALGWGLAVAGFACLVMERRVVGE